MLLVQHLKFWFIPLNHQPQKIGIIGEGKARQRASSDHCERRVPVFTLAWERVRAWPVPHPHPSAPHLSARGPNPGNILAPLSQTQPYPPGTPSSLTMPSFRPLPAPSYGEHPCALWKRSSEHGQRQHRSSGWRVANGNSEQEPLINSLCASPPQWKKKCSHRRCQPLLILEGSCLSFSLAFFFFSFPQAFLFLLFFFSFFSFFLTPPPPFAASVLHPLFRLF